MSPAPESQSHSDPQLVGIERVLVTCAHPDDVDFGAAGTVARWTAAGVEVTYCFVTDGEAGGLEDEPDRARVARMRRSEQTRAAGEVGVETLEFLAYRDGRVEPSLALRRDLTRVIRTYRPDRILTQSPERRWDRIDPGHPDHLADPRLRFEQPQPWWACGWPGPTTSPPGRPPCAPSFPTPATRSPTPSWPNVGFSPGWSPKCG